MVISFTVDDAFEHLREHGYVVTFRASRRKRPNCETWCNRGRGESKAFDVRVSEITRIEDKWTLGKFDKLSGLGWNWHGVIEDLHGSVPDDGWLYLVVRRDAEADVVADGGEP